MNDRHEEYRLAMLAAAQRAEHQRALERDNRQTIPELIASANALYDLIYDK